MIFKCLVHVLILFVVGCGKKSEKEYFQTSYFSSEVNEYLFLMNEYRIQIGLLPLIETEGIQEVAFYHSANMSRRKSPFGHYGFKFRCSRLFYQFQAKTCGEIVAMGQKTPKEVLDAWLNSPPHREAIENPDWTHTGLGLASSSSGRLYWTQMFLKI